jgi:hypothetical protein
VPHRLTRLDQVAGRDQLDEADRAWLAAALARRATAGPVQDVDDDGGAAPAKRARTRPADADSGGATIVRAELAVYSVRTLKAMLQYAARAVCA